MGNASTSTFANTAAIANTATTANQATKLATPRTINGVPFDGSSNITVVVDANYLSGNTLNANVTASNLSSVGTITAGVWSGSTIAISNGGTGATTKSAAFDALSPLNSSGDLLVGGTTGTGTRLAKGNDGSSLMVSSGIPAWKTGVSKVATATDNYTLTLADHVLVMGVSTAASKTITLPAATGNQGKEFFIKNISSYPMSLVATGTE
jgi:hypothetical protein